MSSKLRVTCLLAAAGACAPAFAQDSVSADFTGDALNPYAATQQCAEYVVDLVPVTSSKGHVFGVAPLIKSPQADPLFFNNLISAQAISRDLLTGVPAFAATYDLWENEPGAGINTAPKNTAPGSFTAPASTSQFAAAFADFGGNYNGVVGAIVNYDPSDSNRLLVARRQAAINGANSAQNLSQLGMGAVDANGNTFFRSDTGAATPNFLHRTRMDDRACNTLNIIGGVTNANDQLMGPDATAHSAPQAVAASIIGGNGIVATGNFNAEYVYGFGPTTAVTTHRGAAVSNQRGCLGVSRYNLLNGAGAVASLGMLGQNAAGDTKLINVWTVSGTGAPINNFGFAPPASITDNETGVIVNAPDFELDHYHSQVAFRGGSGQVALTQDVADDGLIAATRDFVTNGTNLPLNDIIVGRFDPANPAATIEWTLAAYINPFSTTGGKPICDENGMAIGRLEELFDLTGGNPVGPSMSSPAFDSAGNVWFVGVVGFFAAPVPLAQAGSTAVLDFDSSLIRAIYDPATFSYSLEKVVGLGDIIPGANSGTDYQISFMGIADGDSVSSGTFFSGNVNELAWNDTDRTTLSPEDPRTNGGVVVNVEITYDVNGNGEFDPDLETDEDYQVLLYVGYFAENTCPCDCDGNGELNLDDLDCFISGFLGGDLIADCDGNGELNLDDLDCFINCFLGGCE